MVANDRRLNSFTRALKENDNISDKFKELIHEVFDGMYVAMGKKNFLRWINIGKLSDRIKELVVEEFNKEDIEKYSNWVGYYTHGTNKMKLKDTENIKKTARHELNHFLTDMKFNGDTFPTFINEGLTEYLNREFEKFLAGTDKVAYSYAENVDFAEFLHNIMGDSLIKAYLSGVSEEFSSQLSSYLTPDGKENINALNDFYKKLERVHFILHPTKTPETEVEKAKLEQEKNNVRNDIYPDLKNVMINICVNSIRKKAQGLEYYKDESLDSDSIVDDINLLIKTMEKTLGKRNAFGISLGLSEDSYKTKEKIMRESLSIILKESHIDNDSIQKILEDVIKPWSISKSPYGGLEGSPAQIDIRKLAEEIKIADKNTVIKSLIEKRLGDKNNYINNGAYDISAFLMEASLILDKFEVESEQKRLLMDSAILRYVPSDIDPSVVKNMIDKYSGLYAELYKKKQEDKLNVVDSKFVKVRENVFIEKRDNSFYYLRYDEKTGKFLSDEMNPRYEDYIMRLSKDVIDKIGNSARRLTYYDRSGPRTKVETIVFNDDFTNVMINGREANVMNGPKALADSCLIDETMKSVIEGIKGGKYVSILNDGETPLEGAMYTWVVPDTRSRVVNFKLFANELSKSISNLPSEYRDDVSKSAVSLLINRTYNTDFGDIEKLRQIIDSGKLSDHMLTDETLDTIYSMTEELNRCRRTFIERESKRSAMILSNEAHGKFKEKQEEIAKRRDQKEFNQSVNSFVISNCNNFIEGPLEVRSDAQHYTTLEGVKYWTKDNVHYATPAAEKVDYKAFSEKLRDVIKVIPEDKRKIFIKKVVRGCTEIWYGTGSGYPDKEDEIFDRRYEQEEELIKIMTDNVINGQELPFEQIKQIEAEFLEISKEEEKICKKILDRRTPRAFEFSSVEQAYNMTEMIHNNEMLSEEQKGIIIKNLQMETIKNTREKRKMTAFGKLALSGANIPSTQDINNATKIINFYEKDVGRGE